MHELFASQSPESLHSDGESGQSLRVVGGEELCSDVPGRIEHVTGAANRLDAYLTRLKELRSYYKRSNQPQKERAIVTAIQALREVM